MPLLNKAEIIGIRHGVVRFCLFSEAEGRHPIAYFDWWSSTPELLDRMYVGDVFEHVGSGWLVRPAIPGQEELSLHAFDRDPRRTTSG